MKAMFSTVSSKVSGAITWTREHAPSAKVVKGAAYVAGGITIGVGVRVIAPIVMRYFNTPVSDTNLEADTSTDTTGEFTDDAREVA